MAKIENYDCIYPRSDWRLACFKNTIQIAKEIFQTLQLTIICSIIMAKIKNLDFIEEILKNQLKVRKHTPQNVAILFNLSII